jgi:hypothetical protein
MSKFCPLGSCQLQFFEEIEALMPDVIPRSFLNQLGICNVDADYLTTV